MAPLFPVFGVKMKPRGRQYRSIKRKFRGTFTSPSNYGADVAGVPRPPVRQRRKYKLWRW